MKLAVSFLSEKDDKIKKLNDTNLDYIHYDVIDGIFCEGKCLSFEKMESLNFTKPKDIHLMVKNVKKYVDLFKNLKPEFITFHIEALDNVKEMIDYIHSLNIKVGLALNPDTSLDKIMPYLKYIDLVLVMSVFPGKGGQKFIDVSDKIKKLKEMNYSFVIEVDGGINNETIKFCKLADILVVGSYITSGNYEERIGSLWKEMDLL